MIDLVLVGFGFAVLAGIGGGLILDHVNPAPNRKRLGWLLLGVSLPFAALCLFFGLP